MTPSFAQQFNACELLCRLWYILCIHHNSFNTGSPSVPQLCLHYCWPNIIFRSYSLFDHYRTITRGNTETIQTLLVTHLTQTQNFVKYDAVSVTTLCSFKVIPAIKISILGHNYITSTAKKLSLQRRITEAIMRLPQNKTHPKVVIIC